MLYFDLKTLIFVILAMPVGLILLTHWLSHRSRNRQMVAALPNSRAMQPILEQAPFGYLILNAPRTCRYANAYARHLLGLQPGHGLLPDTPWLESLWEDCHAAHQKQASRYRYVPLSDNHFAQWWVFAADDLIVVFLLDVTAQQQAKQSAQLLFSGFSHEFRTPIATILTHLEVLSVPGLSKDVEQQSLHLLKQETQRLSRLVNQMLVLGRLESGDDLERRPINLLAIVEDTVAQTAPAADERRLTLSIEAEPPLPAIAGDEQRLKQVMLNLLENAIKYTSPQGQITISLHHTADGLTCTVADNGPGIPAEHLPYVTRHFYRAASGPIEGSGLGLAITNEILQRHHSRLIIESTTEANKSGTRVLFTLPVLREDLPTDN